MYIVGRKPVMEALRSQTTVAKVFLRFGAQGGAIEEIRFLCRRAKVPCVELPREKFARISQDGTLDQGVAALVEDVNLRELGDVLVPHPSGAPPFFIALDSITDPHNAGAIIRTAECAGAQAVILPRDGSTMITDVVVKASAGAVAHMPIVRVANLHRALEEMKMHDIWIVGLDSNTGSSLFSTDLSVPICVVVGSEGKGMRPLIRKICDILVHIPMAGRIGSLNASVAAALMMYEVMRCRGRDQKSTS